MKKLRTLTIKRANRPESIEHFDARLMRSITPATNPALDENPEFGPVKQSSYDRDVLKNWSKHYRGCPPPSFGQNMTCQEFLTHINDGCNQQGED